MSSSGRSSFGGVGQERAGVVARRVLLRVAEVALGVEGVVEPPLGDRGAGDGGVEDVGPAQHRERRQVAAEAPAADGDAGQVEPGVLRRQRQQAVDLVLEHGTGEVAVDRPLPLGTAAGRAAPVDHDDREPLVGEPLRGEVGGLRLHDPLGVRPAVRVERARGTARRPRRWGGGGRWPGGARRRGGSSRSGSRAVSRPSPARLGPPTTATDGAWLSSETRRTTTVSPPTTAEWTPSSAVSCSSPASVHRHTDVPVASSIGLAVNTTRSAPTSATARTWRSSGVTGVPPTTSRRVPSVSRQTTTRPSASRAGRARRALHPRVVVVGPQRLGGAGARIDAADLDAPLVAGVQARGGVRGRPSAASAR